ncbi:hypothetical protein MJD09_17615, partial [bacterium]|nr:hypothetical protein [bacterium]
LVDPPEEASENSHWGDKIVLLCVTLLIIPAAGFLHGMVVQKSWDLDGFVWWLAYWVAASAQPTFVLAYLQSPARDLRQRASRIIGELKLQLPNYMNDAKEEEIKRKERWLGDVEAEILSHYHPHRFIFAFLFLVLVNSIGFFILFSMGLKLINLKVVDDMIVALPGAVGAGFMGGWFYALYSVLGRYRSADISPGLVLQLGYQMLVATAVGFFVGEIGDGEAEAFVAFALAFVPYSQLVLWLRSQAERRTGIQSEFAVSSGMQEKFAKQSIATLQGITRPQFERLFEENITTVQHLAFANPLKIYMTTSFGLNQILDWIDQAYLRIYLGEDVCNKLAPLGIRGAIEMAVLQRRFASLGDDGAQNLRRQIGAVIGSDDESLDYLIHQLKEDPRVMFLHMLWDLFGGL